MNNITSKNANHRKLSIGSDRLRLVAILATLVLAGLAVLFNFELPAFWAFLGLVITALLGQPNNV